MAMWDFAGSGKEVMGGKICCIFGSAADGRRRNILQKLDLR